jgi:hypothetical protein
MTLVCLGSSCPSCLDLEDFFLLPGDLEFYRLNSEPFLLLSDYYSFTALIPDLPRLPLFYACLYFWAFNFLSKPELLSLALSLSKDTFSLDNSLFLLLFEDEEALYSKKPLFEY